MQNLAHLGHLDHEGRLTAGEVVARADTFFVVSPEYTFKVVIET